MFNCNWKNNGKLKLLIIVGTRPEIIRLAAVIKKCRAYFDTILAHTGQNYDYNLNGVFFHDLALDDPEVYLPSPISSWSRSSRMQFLSLVTRIPACR
jgi:UDP-N-acetylglucosamine 2-epimerase (non-hydrolysing)